MDNLTFYLTRTISSSSSIREPVELPYPKSLELQVVPNIVNEIHTMSGKTLYDINGWKYADTTIEWGSLYPEMLERLIHVVEDGPTCDSLTMEFIQPDGTTKEITVVIKNFKKAKTLVRYGDDYVWEGVSLQVSFPECYQY